MGRDQGNQGRSGNLSETDRSRGGQTSANEQNRDDQGQFTGTGMNQRRETTDPGSNLGNQGRDDQGQFTGSTGQARHGSKHTR
jgi:hypothetical protein